MAMKASAGQPFWIREGRTDPNDSFGFDLPNETAAEIPQAKPLNPLASNQDASYVRPMLSFVGLTKRYGDVVALDQATFEAPAGRIVGFLGPNGAGKTTAMRCVFGLAQPDEGAVTWDGRPVDEADRLSFGYMPEERGMYPKMRLNDQLVYFGRLAGLSPSDANEQAGYWLSRLGLADRAGSKVDELSHGNQQRMQLAVAVVGHPKLLILDEPFAGLDPLGVETMADLLGELAMAGTGILFSSHQLDLVEDICEDVVIINQGRVVLAGNVEGLRSQSDHIRVEVTVDGHPWTPDSPEYVPASRSVRGGSFIVGHHMTMEQVKADAERSGSVSQFSYGPPHLSDLFRSAVNHA